ncbi:hypothetical protein V8F06_007007 [Rhypophila decipiens]
MPLILVFAPKTSGPCCLSPFLKTIRNRSTSQALLIATSLFGTEGMPCSACFNANLVTPGSRVCVYSSASRRCGECMKRKVFCDGNDVGPALSASLDARFNMVEEEEKLEDEIISLQSKLLTLRRRRRAQEARARELLGRGGSFSGRGRSFAAGAYSGIGVPSPRGRSSPVVLCGRW